VKRFVLAMLTATALTAPSGAMAAPHVKERRLFVGPVVPSVRSLEASGWREPLLVEFRRGRRGSQGERAARAAGATRVSKTLHIWLLSAESSRKLLPGLIRSGAIAGVQHNHKLKQNRRFSFTDPLWQYEWWRTAVGAETVSYPGPGVPITVIDSGVDIGHPEFRGAQIIPLNQQVLTDSSEDMHGTEVTSVAAAPANGIGMVGIYPTARVWTWDARDLSDANIIAGIDAAVRRGPSVINMSFAGTDYDPMLDQAVLVAFGTGSVPVAAAGNEFDVGNPVEFPASLNHVLTVAATDESNQPTYFSNANDAVDFAAPGQDIVAADPVTFNPEGWSFGDGTSFSAPIGSAATAWVWTARPNLDQTQIFDLMRYSAQDLGTPGFDADTGFGLLDLPAALIQQAPPPDPHEPNEDIYMVKKNGLFATADAPLTRPGHGSSTTLARLDYTEDPEDVYRFWVPAHFVATVRVQGDANVDLEIWNPNTKSVYERGTALKRDLIGASRKAGTQPDVISIKNGTKHGGYGYADVFLGKDAGDAQYRIKLTTWRPR
jgi:Subtilase family